MTPTDIISEFRRKVCDKISLEQEGISGRFVIYTPFMFDDGDHFVVVLKRIGDEWIITDEGHTFMHMEYTGVDFSVPTRLRVIEDALEAHAIEDRDGELVSVVPDNQFGDALFSFVQGLSQISSVTKFTKEFVHSTFMYEFDSVIRKAIPDDSLIAHWRADFDPDGRYEADFCVRKSDRPWLIFGINSENKCKDATIACWAIEKHMEFNSLAIFEDQVSISRSAVARLSDVIGKQFSSLGDRDRIEEYLKSEILEQPKLGTSMELPPPLGLTDSVTLKPPSAALPSATDDP